MSSFQIQQRDVFQDIKEQKFIGKRLCARFAEQYSLALGDLREAQKEAEELRRQLVQTAEEVIEKIDNVRGKVEKDPVEFHEEVAVDSEEPNSESHSFTSNGTWDLEESTV